MKFIPGMRVYFKQCMSSTSGIVKQVFKLHVLVMMDNGHTLRFPIEDLELREQP